MLADPSTPTAKRAAEDSGHASRLTEAKAAAAVANAVYETELERRVAWEPEVLQRNDLPPVQLLVRPLNERLDQQHQQPGCCGGFLPAARRRAAGRVIVAAMLLALSVVDLDTPFSINSVFVASELGGTRIGIAGAAATVVQVREDDELEWCGPHLASCWAWKHDRSLRKLAPVIVLVGNEAYQQLPTVGYGGIETSVDNTAHALHQLGVDFFAVVPRVTQPAAEPYPFRIVETTGFVVRSGRDKWAYVAEVRAVLAREAEVLGRPLVIWGQSFWSQDFSEAGIVAIASHHDGGGPPDAQWNRNMPTVRHRFLCHDQQSRWMQPTDPVAARSRVIPHGLNGGDFRLCSNKGYFLWVAGLGWGASNLTVALLRTVSAYLSFGAPFPSPLSFQLFHPCAPSCIRYFRLGGERS
jgi:hypothetical protein